MADCIQALITADLLTALRTVTVLNGYNTDCGTVEEMRTIFSFPDSDPFTLVQLLPKDVSDDFQHTEDDFVRYEVFHFSGENDDRGSDPIQFASRNVAADFQKAIMTDRTRGGYAQNTEIETAGNGVFSDSSGNLIPCTYLQIKVQVLINADNPYELG